MRARTLFGVGAGVTVILVVVGVVLWQIVPDPADRGMAFLVVLAPSTVVLLVVIGFLAGWFGHDRDEVTFVAIGTGLTGAVVAAVGALVAESRGIQAVGAAVAVVAMIVVVSAAGGQIAWAAGNVVCVMRGLPTARLLVAPLYIEDYPGYPLWTTEAGPAIRTTADGLAERLAPGEDVTGRAVGIEVSWVREMPLIVMLAGDRVLIERIALDGTPTGRTRVITKGDLAEVSIRGEAADGSTRREINEFDDVISVRTTEGDLLRLRLPYGTRALGDETGGPEVIRAWCRSNAATYI
jgi:hypothetical protein